VWRKKCVFCVKNAFLAQKVGTKYFGGKKFFVKRVFRFFDISEVTTLLKDSETHCSATSVMFRVDECAFLNARMDPNEVYMAGSTEAARLSPTDDNTCGGIDYGKFWNFSVVNKMTDCGTVLTSNTTHFTYSNAIQV